LLLDGENTGPGTGSIRDARKLTITSEQFQSFLDRHKSLSCLVPEDNESMKDSYLLLDEEMRFVLFSFANLIISTGRRFLACGNGSKRPGRSIFDVGVFEAMQDAEFDSKSFFDRGGIYDWGRETKDVLDW